MQVSFKSKFSGAGIFACASGVLGLILLFIVIGSTIGDWSSYRITELRNQSGDFGYVDLNRIDGKYSWTVVMAVPLSAFEKLKYDDHYTGAPKGFGKFQRTGKVVATFYDEDTTLIGGLGLVAFLVPVIYIFHRKINGFPIKQLLLQSKREKLLELFRLGAWPCLAWGTIASFLCLFQILTLGNIYQVSEKKCDLATAFSHRVFFSGPMGYEIICSKAFYEKVEIGDEFRGYPNGYGKVLRNKATVTRHFGEEFLFMLFVGLTGMFSFTLFVEPKSKPFKVSLYIIAALFQIANFLVIVLLISVLLGFAD